MVNFSKTKLLLGIGTTLCLATLAHSIPANATQPNGWGSWTVSDIGDAGTIDFTTGLADATWTISGVSGEVGSNPEISVQPTAGTGSSDAEYFDANTAIGAAFGANGPTGSNNFLKVGIPNRRNVRTWGSLVLTVTFAKAIYADKLAIAVSDIDSDEIRFYAENAAGTRLTVPQLIGTVGATKESTLFNFCSGLTDPNSVCNGETNQVNWISQDLNGGTLDYGDPSDPNAWNTVGASAWVRPSSAVKKVVFEMWNADSSISSIRLWMAQLPGVPAATTPTGLANTGTNAQGNATIATGLVIAGFTASTIRLRRRRGVARHRA